MCIAVNTLVLAMEYDGMPNSYANALDVINLILTIMFILEMVSKVIGMGFEEYSKDRFNMFDATVVILSIVEPADAARRKRRHQREHLPGPPVEVAARFDVEDVHRAILAGRAG